MSVSLSDYEPFVGRQRIDEIEKLGSHLRGTSLLHVNSTKAGGGVAEILHRMIPLMRHLGIRTEWEVIEGDALFYSVTKRFHNGLQGNDVSLSPADLDHYMEINRANAGRIDLEHDVVLIHDPQPAALVASRRDEGGTWIWRCHIDASRPARVVWKFLEPIVSRYGSSIWSMPEFARALPHPRIIVQPSIDPLHEKNRPMDPDEVRELLTGMGVPMDLPIVLQVSRFDRFKDPLGVVKAWRLASRHARCRLVLAGGGADDDPEGKQVYEEVLQATSGEELAKVLLLPPDAHRRINALQRAAALVLQKSTKEGFGLTVSEAMWKGKPVIGGATGGITAQILDGVNGFLVQSVEGAAYRIRQLLAQPQRAAKMGERGREIVRERFLITRHIRDYLALVLCHRRGFEPVIRL